MKLATIRTRNGHGQHYGMVHEDAFVCLESGFRGLAKEQSMADPKERFGRDVLGFIEHASDARPAADTLLARHKEGKLPEGTVVLKTADLHFLSPIPRPPSMRDGYAFRQHVETARRNRGLEMIPEFDLFPVFYFTNHGAVCGAGELTVRKLHLDKLDFELEAAVVVSKKVRDLTPAQADDAIFGLTIMNDWSARTLQMEEMKLNLGPAKGKDFATGLGPVLVTLDELLPLTQKTPKGLVFNMGMRGFVNGKQLSSGNVNQMNWTFSQILERASYGVDLYPGDVIGSGTVGTGCLLELNGSKITDNLWLKPGDAVVMEIDGLGRLENTIVCNEV
jgi:fumarylacetoacetate (FAA) hydrolase